MKKYKAKIKAVQVKFTKKRELKVKKLCALGSFTAMIDENSGRNKVYLGRDYNNNRKPIFAFETDWICRAKNGYRFILTNEDFIGIYKPKKKKIPKQALQR